MPLCGLCADSCDRRATRVCRSGSRQCVLHPLAKRTLMSVPIYAGIDAGGTEFKCIVASGPDQVLAHSKIPVTYPEATLDACRHFFLSAQAEHGDFESLGIASFGPVDLRQNSPTYGFITSTPKPHWTDTDLVGYFRRALGRPIRFDTD